MIVHVRVIPGAKKTFIKEEGNVLKVYLTAPPVEGKANYALVELLAEHYGVRKGQITIIKGLQSRHKTININQI